MGVGSELGGAATTMWRQRQRIEKHGGRVVDEGGGCGCRWQGGRCGGRLVAAAAAC